MHRFSIKGQPVYPHFKLTNEDFPRVLATRILRQDGDEYFGAFLNRTNVRVLIDFLNRTFRLRTCTIAIDGSFPVPCTQYFAKRCVAPCVANLCDRESYIEMVDLVRLFLRNDRELFLASVSRKIDRASEDLDFESAAFFRDILQSVQTFWSNGRYQVWLDDATDTFELLKSEDTVSVIIVTGRGRRPLGEIVFEFPSSKGDATEALRDVIDRFYVHHLPREIRVSHDFDGRTKLAKELGARFARKVNITVDSDAARRVTAERSLVRTKDRLELEAISNKPSVDEIELELKEMFDLSVVPSRIAAFDAAHISATGFAAAMSVWKDGRDLPNEYEHWISDRTSELETLAAFVVTRLDRSPEKPDMILIDGGASQLNAVLKTLNTTGASHPPVVAAVKPKGRHSSISHFLKEDGTRVEYDPDSHAARLLKRLRDEAHDLANAAHRLSRDMMHFYELAAMLPSLNERERHELVREFGSSKKILELETSQLETRFEKPMATRVAKDLAAFRNGDSPHPQPLIVPIRFVELDGAAEDLIPIEARLAPEKKRNSRKINDGRI